MSGMASGTRARIVQRSAELFRRQGYTGTGVKQIVAEAGAPFGSVYHFFPGGKEQLGAEVIRWSGATYGQLIDAFFEPGADPVAAAGAFFAAAAGTLEETGYADACPIATVALEVSSTSEPMRQACAEVFDGWIQAAAGRLAACGIPPDRARSLGDHDAHFPGRRVRAGPRAAQHGAAGRGGRRGHGRGPRGRGGRTMRADPPAGRLAA